MSLMDCKKIAWKLSPEQSLVLVSAAEQAYSNEGCISVRLDGNGKHVLLVPDTEADIGIVKDTALSWILRGAHVTVFFPQGIVPEEFQQVGDRLHAFCFTTLAKDDLEILLRNVDVVIELFGGENDNGIHVVRLLENFRLIRANIDSKLRFEIDDLPGMELLNFLTAKAGKLAESSVHEFLEVCLALRSVGNIASRSVELHIDPAAQVPEHMIVHASIAALNPFNCGGNRIILGPHSKTMHESAKRFCRFLEGRLGFEVRESIESSDGPLRVINRTSQIDGVAQVDSDPFRIASQHLSNGIATSIKDYKFEILNCRSVKDDSIV
jgi:hypothetical protein